MYYRILSVTSSKRDSCEAYLNTVVTVSEVLHRLELLVNDTDAGLVRPVSHAVNILSRLAHLLQLLVQTLCSLNGRLRVKLGWR